jgi:transposase
MVEVDQVRERFRLLAPVMDERTTRLWAAAEAMSLGAGGVAIVTEATGIRKKRIRIGRSELEAMAETSPTEKPRAQRIRRPGAGRKTVTIKDPTLLSDLESLVDPLTRGDPESPLRWTAKSTRALADELRRQGHRVSARTVAQLLKQWGYSLQANRKTVEGGQHPDRNAQFEHINAQAKAFQAAGSPVISVDTKKKELVGPFKNGGREWLPQGEPEAVRVHDFIDETLGKAIPYGVYDVGRNEGWVNVGVDHDTGEFAVASIERWWRTMGIKAYPNAKELLITADGGGSNGSRNRLWKLSLQQFSDRSGLRLAVCHLPPGTSKWNKIEHRLFSQISQNWRGRPLVSHEVIVNLIASTKTMTGLKVRAKLDKRRYSSGLKITDKQMKSLAIKREAFHGEWNYVISPRAK